MTPTPEPAAVKAAAELRRIADQLAPVPCAAGVMLLDGEWSGCEIGGLIPHVEHATTTPTGRVIRWRGRRP